MLIPRNEVQEGNSEHKLINVSTFIFSNISSYHYLCIDLDKYLTFGKMAENTFSKANKKTLSAEENASLYFLCGG